MDRQPPTPPSRFAKLLIVLAAGLFVAARLANLTTYCLDGDELFSLNAARQSWWGLLDIAAHDVSHPPLFYAILKIWISVGGDSLFWLRLLPVLTVSMSLIPFVLLGRTLELRPSEIALALSLAAFNGFHIYYSQHLRMFALLQLTSLVSLWLFLRLLKSPGNPSRELWLLFLANLVMVYSHYWGWVVLGTQGLTLLILRPRLVLKFAITCVALLATYTPWIAAAAWGAIDKGSAVSQVSWIPKPEWFAVIHYYSMLNGPLPLPKATTVGLILFGIGVLPWAIRLLRGQAPEERQRFVVLAAFAFLPVLVTFAASHLLRQSVWAERQLIVVVPPYLLLVTSATFRLPFRSLRVSVGLLCAAWAAFSGGAALAGGNEKIAWDQLAAEVAQGESGAESPVPVLAGEGFVASPLRYYLEEKRRGGFQVIQQQDLLSPAEANHFWVAYRDTRWKDARTPQEVFEERGYSVGQPRRAGTSKQTIVVFPVWRR